ncbi:hypothetical protein HON01_11780 [Candidatus Woesearchaeota archaeon]|jgi:hypothetical protein|nr:hypothetical protein [archaeon]MBT5023492.1 hypothetical protein [Candidatus Woesearchaeota archaeon]MBT4022603.1 hypothetical protein [archaeon]MBT4272043.1 hypothetical protein [archaeon]MBT4461140.1 hypothetical protein [archaeon]
MKFKKDNLVYNFLNKLDSFLKKLANDPKKVMGVAILSIIGLIVITKFRSILFFVLLNLLASVSMMYLKISKHAHYIGLELCTLATVLISLKYGHTLGMITGFISITSALIVSGYFKPTYFVSVLTMPLIGIITPLFSNLSLWQIGLIMTLMYDAIVLPLYIFMGSRIISSVIFFITHVLFNYWVFTTLAPVLFNLM